MTRSGHAGKDLARLDGGKGLIHKGLVCEPLSAERNQSV